MNVHDWLARSQATLSVVGIGTARLDCLVLLEDVTGCERAWLLAHPEHELQIEQCDILNTFINQRARHIPLAYLRGKTEFYAREFKLTTQVLEPRPESETMIDMVKSLAKSWTAKTVTIADIGTGSGALAITAKLEWPVSNVYAADIDEQCLDLTRTNAAELEADIEVFVSDLLDGFRAIPVDMLLCNLPYVPDSFQINPAAMNEPKLAIFGGHDGLEIYKKLFDSVKYMPHLPQYILTESMPMQHQALIGIARNHGYELQRSDDFIQLFVPV